MFSLFQRSKRHLRSANYSRPRWVNAREEEDDDSINGLEVDFDLLRKRGLITHETIDEPLGREFSLIKRRLLRRLDFFNHKKNGARPGEDERCPLVLFSSSKPGEGKTFSACNFALGLALEEQMRVLLIDADLAKPSVPEVFDYPEDQPGLFDCLKDSSRDVRNDLLRLVGTNVTVLPAGWANSSPAHLLGSEVMLRILDAVSYGEKAYDFVVLDGPPLLATTEAAILANYADEVMLVVGAGDVTTSQIQSSIDMLGVREKTSLMINHMPIGEPLPTEYGYYGRSAA